MLKIAAQLAHIFKFKVKEEEEKILQIQSIQSIHASIVDQAGQISVHLRQVNGVHFINTDAVVIIKPN